MHKTVVRIHTYIYVNRYKNDSGASLAWRRRKTWKERLGKTLRAQFEELESAPSLKTSLGADIEDNLKIDDCVIEPIFQELAKPKYQNLKFTNYQKRIKTLNEIAKRLVMVSYL